MTLTDAATKLHDSATKTQGSGTRLTFLPRSGFLCALLQSCLLFFLKNVFYLQFRRLKSMSCVTCLLFEFPCSDFTFRVVTSRSILSLSFSFVELFCRWLLVSRLLDWLVHSFQRSSRRWFARQRICENKGTQSLLGESKRMKNVEIGRTARKPFFRP